MLHRTGRLVGRKRRYIVPKRDGTGPFGIRPEAVRGTGFQAAHQVGCFANPWLGRGYFCCRRGSGRTSLGTAGRGFNWKSSYGTVGRTFWVQKRNFQRNCPPSPTPRFVFSPKHKETETDYLKSEASILEKELKSIKERIENLIKDTCGRKEADDGTQ